MRFHFALTIQALWTGVCQAAMQHYPAAWGHYDVCKSQVYTEEGLTWDYMACQPEAADMTQFLKVTLDPPNITCGDPPETYCTLVSTCKNKDNPKIINLKIKTRWETTTRKHTKAGLCVVSPIRHFHRLCDEYVSAWTWRSKRFVPIDILLCCRELLMWLHQWKHTVTSPSHPLHEIHVKNAIPLLWFHSKKYIPLQLFCCLAMFTAELDEWAA